MHILSCLLQPSNTSFGFSAQNPDVQLNTPLVQYVPTGSTEQGVSKGQWSLNLLGVGKLLKKKGQQQRSTTETATVREVKISISFLNENGEQVASIGTQHNIPVEVENGQWVVPDWERLKGSFYMESFIRRQKPSSYRLTIEYSTFTKKDNIPLHLDNFFLKTDGVQVVQANSYFPFGGVIEDLSRRGNPDHKYLYQSKEFEEDFGLKIYDNEWRQYDPFVARSLQIDPHSENYYPVSPYGWVANNPINIIDSDGRDITPRITKDEIDENGQRQVTIAFDVTIRIINNSNTPINMSAYKKNLISLLKEAFTGSYSTQTAQYTFEAGKIDIDHVTSMDQVVSSDHLITIVDDVTGETTDKYGNKSEAAGRGPFDGRIIYTEPSSDLNWLAEHTIHEIGHSAGRLHSWVDEINDTDNPQNYMSYNRECPCEFTGSQLIRIANNPNINSGSNSEISDSSWDTNKTTEKRTQRKVVKGQKIPKTDN